MPDTSPAGPVRSEELKAVTARWVEAIDRSDVESGLSRFSDEGWTAGWGTDVGEFLTDIDVLRRYTRLDVDAGSWQVWAFGDAEIDSWTEGPVGWSLIRSTVELESGPQEVRVTLIFHLERDEWKIVHTHWSFAASEALWGGSPGATLELLKRAAETERPDLRQWTSDEGTTTLVFTDIEGSTALNASFGDRAWMQVLHAHNQVVAGATERHGGKVVKGQGDGFMLAFGSARQALACAMAIQRDIASTFSDPGSPVRVRIGMHTGEPIADAEDFFGHAVNYAARVAQSAAAEEILVSRLVHDIVEPTGEFAFGQPRQVELRGVRESALVYPVVYAPAAG